MSRYEVWHRGYDTVLIKSTEQSEYNSLVMSLSITLLIRPL